ncbi:MAG: M48 family metallopeptidase [Nanoarchaeota archaeon]|nr:M48 family metallopeptidase [Nanoarchaeota archaeon]
MVSFFDEIRINKIKSVILIFLVIGVLIALGYTIALVYNPAFTLFFVLFALVIAITESLYAYYKGDKLILKLVNAKPAKKPEHAHLINVVEGLSLAAGIPPPKVYVIENPDINAFATGRDPKHASIAVTTGALEKLDRIELEGVVGHEIGHIKNYDIRFATLVVILVGIIAIVSGIFLRSFWFRDRDRKAGAIVLVGLLFAILAPIAAKLVQLAISRKREYLADAYSAKLTRYPEGLASALEKIMKYNKGVLKVDDSVSSLFIANPKKKIAELFSTHPPIEKRIAILRAM